MKNCLIYQPLGLGDILMIQSIVDHLIQNQFTVYYPVNDLYYDAVKKHIKKNNLIWVKENEEFPLKQFYGMAKVNSIGDDLYLPLGFADSYFLNAPIMATKHYFMNLPIPDWRNHVDIIRDYEKEQELKKAYNLNDKFVLVNTNFGSNPVSRTINVQSNKLVHRINYSDSVSKGFTIFDWIGAIEDASEIHSVETSFCYLVDKFAKTTNINMYEKRLDYQPIDFFKNIGLVYRNGNWKYHA